MEMCLGGRRSKQKQQQQKHVQPQQQLLHSQMHSHYPNHCQQLKKPSHLHQRPISQEKYDQVIMSHESSTRSQNCFPVSQLVLSHLPPTPNNLPPGKTLTKRQMNMSGIGQIFIDPRCGEEDDGLNDHKNMSTEVKNDRTVGIIPVRRIIHQYQEDLDTIEVCSEQESISGRPFRAGISESMGGASNVGKGDNHSSKHANIIKPIKWSGINIPTTSENIHLSEPTAGAISHIHPDYSYAYYEPGMIMRHSNVPPPEQTTASSRPPPPNSIRALLSKGKKNKQLVSPSTRQSYQTRWQENFYEEIASDETSSILLVTDHSLPSINQNMAEEFRRVQNRHRKILGELNLSVEAMLMPETPPNGSPTEEDTVTKKNSESSNAELLNTVGPTDELSPISSTNAAFCVDLDSGFSGSSGASYIGSLRYHKTNAALSSIMTAKSSIPESRNSNSFYSSSCRSSQRSRDEFDEDRVVTGRSSYGNKGINYSEVKSAEDPGPSNVTESKAKSFWNRKGWRKLPGFSSTSNILQAGIDERRLNSNSWENILPITTSVADATTATTSQLHPTLIQQSDPLNSRLSYNGIHSHIILSHHHNENCDNNHSNSSNITTVSNVLHPQQTVNNKTSTRTINSSEDSCCSERENDISSDEETDVRDHSVTSITQQRNSQLRSTFNKAKQHLSFDKWRTSGGGGGNSGNHHQQYQQQICTSGNNSRTGTVPSSTMPATIHQQQQDSSTPGESPGGRLSRWFSIRRGSIHQYDVGGRDGRVVSSAGKTDAIKHGSPKAANTKNVGTCSGKKLPQLSENEDDPSRGLGLDLLISPNSRANGKAKSDSRLMIPPLPSAPAGL